MPLTLTRAILVIIIPGLLTLAPWILWLVLQYEEVSSLYKDYSTLINAAIIVLAIIIGTIIEGLMSFLEVKWDKEHEEKYQVRENWYAYLSQQCMTEPIGFRYLSHMFNMLYFELSMMIASPIALAGFAFITYKYFPKWYVLISALLLAIFSILFFRKQAKDSYDVLCKTRLELNNRINQSRTS